MASEFDKFQLWDVSSLKNYLKERGLSYTGRKEVLVARAFGAHEQQLPVKLKPSEIESRLQSEYKSLLQIEGVTLPDPMSELEKGWLAEEEGKYFWPQTLIGDIGRHLGKHECKVNFIERIMNEYKEQKAFSYYKSIFVYEVLFHDIGPSSDFCFLKSKVIPSQKIRDVPHECWIAINKTTGTIKSAWCSCFAG